MWQAISKGAAWRNAGEVLSVFPATKFVTPKLANFPLVGGDCSVSTQIAFHSGVLIVLGITNLRSQPLQGL
jgi:hypothetical protein